MTGFGRGSYQETTSQLTAQHGISMWRTWSSMLRLRSCVSYLHQRLSWIQYDTDLALFINGIFPLSGHGKVGTVALSSRLPLLPISLSRAFPLLQLWPRATRFRRTWCISKITTPQQPQPTVETCHHKHLFFLHILSHSLPSLLSPNPYFSSPTSTMTAAFMSQAI